MKNKLLIIFLIVGFLLMTIVSASLIFIIYKNSEYRKNYDSHDPGTFKSYVFMYKEGVTAEEVIQTLDQNDYQVRYIYENIRAFSLDVNPKAYDMLRRNPNITSIENNLPLQTN